MKRFLCGILATISCIAAPAKADDVQQQIKCLADNIYHEARGEPTLGQIAVAYVTINRTQSNKFPKTICEVVHQRDQFSWVKAQLKVTDYRTYQESWYIANMVWVSYDASTDPTKGALYFENLKYSHFHPTTMIIGHHAFH